MKLSISNGAPYQGVAANTQLLNIELEKNEVLEPSALKELSAMLRDLEINLGEGIIINGRAPIWLYGAIVDELCEAAWVATNDLRLGAVVVFSRVPNINPGQTLSPLPGSIV
ncbi:MAG TPA: CRISPR-associated ring nuclease Crn3/Csx3 [Leptolyngbyaceae cyanobacterium]